MSSTNEAQAAETNSVDKDTTTMAPASQQEVSEISLKPELVKTETPIGVENLQPIDHEVKDEQRLSEQPPQLLQIKKEESQGPPSIRGESPAAIMPPKSKKKAAPAVNKKPGPKKRKIEADSRGDTPQSQRSGTPNSTLGGKTASRARKPNSATPLHSSPAPGEDEEDEESDDGIYCICRKPDDHSWMIGCDLCEEWFHGRCIGLVKEDQELVQMFVCPDCSTSKDTETTWKLMCRLEGCRRPAAISAPKPSKYCCDDHATKFFRQYLKKGLGSDSSTIGRKRRKDNYTDNTQNAGDNLDKPAHLRGGLLLPTELKAITKGLTSAQEFRVLGQSVSVPTNDNHNADAMQIDSIGPNPSSYETEQLEKCITRQQKLQTRLKSLEDREKFLTLVKSRAKSVSEELKKKDKTLKDICGFDKRLRWYDDQFETWRQTEEGQEAFRTNKLEPPAVEDQIDADGDANMVDGATEDLGRGVCQKKRCKQHEGWYKLHSQEFTFNKLELTRELARLASEERGIRERAMIRHLEAQAGPDGCDGYF